MGGGGRGGGAVCVCGIDHSMIPSFLPTGRPGLHRKCALPAECPESQQQEENGFSRRIKIVTTTSLQKDSVITYAISGMCASKTAEH